ncbi:hypothetical protein AUJ44_02950 [Candidatus Nomurabacteria bacterium CG1_02_47_685]|uniref:Cell shape-determining protein MreC n=1 Tax=Candidatus Nomurabacteria bacterium CG1_02_47_685 TaxID=1805282 RepID=A0A1J4VDC7_9BACT|nr:MAG: hypothetical protein AUJ44_02950 [Candidatus Nomurabacteria bacterium CG1_02_47_685]
MAGDRFASMRKQRNIQKRTITFFVTVGLVSIFLFADGYGFLSRSVGFMAVSLWKTQNYAGNLWGGFRNLVRSKKSLVDENTKLKEDLRVLSMKLLDRNLLFEENLDLKEAMGRSVLDRTVLASVLAGPGQSLYDTLIIDIGEDFGVEIGDEVLYAGNIMIGKVTEVLKRSSKVVLFSSPGELTDVLVGDEKITTTAKGRAGGNYEIRLPRDIAIAEGDVVLLPGIMPRIVGYVEYIDVKTSDPFKLILFRDVVDSRQVREVEVVLRDKEIKK